MTAWTLPPGRWYLPEYHASPASPFTTRRFASLQQTRDIRGSGFTGLEPMGLLHRLLICVIRGPRGERFARCSRGQR
jgi:hypothetical protein